ncbi:hypothetical protein DT075_37800 [Bacillus licheniformis]|nr:hypothetical protein DT075_37800 [Bacillus licheniformis]
MEHTGDNLTGEGSGDDEQIIVDLQKVPSHIHKLVFVVNIYDCVKRSQHFGMIENAFIRIVNLTKGKAGLSKILVGLGWDPVASGSGGFFGKLFGGGTPNIDCDASVLMLENGRVTENKNVIYFGNLRNLSVYIVKQVK